MGKNTTIKDKRGDIPCIRGKPQTLDKIFLLFKICNENILNY